MLCFKAILLDSLIAQARPIFAMVYSAQMERLLHGLDRVEPENVAAYFAAQFDGEPDLVNDAVADFYRDAAEQIAIDTLDGIDSPVTYDQIAAQLLATADARATWFAETMTQTSLEKTQAVIAKWQETGGTLPDLKEEVRKVWTGPRPDVAAVTESTNMSATARAVAWKESGVVWGYNVHTANDDRVRPSHTEVANNGPYPLSDTVHRPPINGDANCRCFTTPVLRNPNG